jgi:SAM-dependent MidA family methyltransferase
MDEHVWALPSEAGRIAREFPSYRDFVDDALFDPSWGYYGSGKVRFGDAAHFDTFPLALSPLFGRLLAEYAHRSWRRGGGADRFEVCEIGGGNGQLCADCVLWIWERARHEPSWKRFAAAFRYRIIERSPALIDRQRELLGPLAGQVAWTRAELTRSAPRSAPLAKMGLVFANEVLDCQAHHKIVANRGGPPGVVFVVPRLRERAGSPRGGGAKVARRELGRVLADPRLRRRLRFEEVLLPLGSVRGLEAFLRRRHPDLFDARGPASLRFVCPRFEALVRNAGRLYSRGEVLWIDYGVDGSSRRRAAPRPRVFAGRPGSGRTVYDAPGLDDISFLVDFAAVADAGRRAGMRIEYCGPQAELAKRSGIRFDRNAVDLIVRTRALQWLLAVIGVGPERQWRRASIGWGETRPSSLVPVRRYVQSSVAQFLGKTPSQFKLMIMRTGG